MDLDELKTDVIKNQILSIANELLNQVEEVLKRNIELDEQNKTLREWLMIGRETDSVAHWIDFDENVEEQRPKDGELVVVQVGNAQPYMFTYLKGCKLKINKWLRIPEWKEVI